MAQPAVSKSATAITLPPEMQGSISGVGPNIAYRGFSRGSTLRGTASPRVTKRNPLISIRTANGQELFAGCQSLVFGMMFRL
jgi:hypothetical protein